jgi:hypothetical protein
MKMTPPGTNTSLPESFTTTTNIATASGPMNVTVPLGTYEAYQINYTNTFMTNNTATILFGQYVGQMLGSMAPQIESWYSEDAQNFVKYFLDMSPLGNITIELVSKPPVDMTMLLLFTLSNNIQQQGSFNLLLIGGGVAAAAIAIVVIAFVLVRRGG